MNCSSHPGGNLPSGRPTPQESAPRKVPLTRPAAYSERLTAPARRSYFRWLNATEPAA